MTESIDTPSSSNQRSRRRRARLKEAGVLVITCELSADVAELLALAAKIANMPPAHLAETIISKHFMRMISGPKKRPFTRCISK